MKSRTLLRTGIIGSVVTGLCCFTPILVFLLGAVGMSAMVGWLDYILLPSLMVFAFIAGYALWKRRRTE